MPRRTEVIKQSPVLYRDLMIDTRSIDKENRTVEISFSSETPVTRWGEVEILDHSKGSVRLERAKSNGPLLVDHNWRDQIGTIEKIFIDEAARVGRAIVRFGKGERASEIFNDVVDGIRKSISVGYRIFKVVLETQSEDKPDEYRVIDWEPLELSFVSVPADITVGVGREESSSDTNDYVLIRNEVKDMPREKVTTGDNTRSNQSDPAEIERQAQQIIENERQADVQRRRSIENIAATYEGHEDLVREALSSSMTVDDFVERITEAELKKREDDTPETDLGMEDKEVARYSIIRALNAQLTNNWSNAGLEREASEAISDRIDREARGVLVPWDIQTRNLGQRVITTTGDGSGAVGTELRPGSFIDLLRDSALVMRLGGRLLGGLRGNLDLPRKTGSATFTLVDEDEDSTTSQMSVGTLNLVAKTMAGSTPISRKALLQSTPDMEQLVMIDLAEGAGLFMDILALVGGQSVSTNTSIDGITGTTGVLTQTITTPGSPTWAEVVGFETAVTAANALNGQNFITTAAVRGNMKTTKKDAGSGIFLIEDNRANGAGVYAKTDTAFAANTIIYGDFTRVLFGMWGVMDLLVDTATKAASGGIVVRAFQDLDVGITQPTAMCKNA